MKATTKILSVLTTGALIGSLVPVTVSAEENHRQQVRLVIENNTLTAENGADWTGTLIDEWVAIDENTTAANVLLSVLAEHNYTQQGAEFDYITDINGLSAEDGGAMGGWLTSLDDWITDEALSAYTVASGKLEGGDEIRLSYSCSWGADLGYDWSGSATTLSDVIFSAGEVSEALSDENFEYLLTLPEGVDHITVKPIVGNKAYRAKVYKNDYTPAQKDTDYKTWEEISVADGDRIVIGIANPAWMQSNYNNASETIYVFHINQSVQTADAEVQAAENLIAAIGTVTKESSTAIEQARRCYDALSDEQKASVENAAVLFEAEKTFAELNKSVTVLRVSELRGKYLSAVKEMPVYGNEWEIINLCRFGLADENVRKHYVESVREAVQALGSATLSQTRSTVNAGVVMALTACGVNPADFCGYNLIRPLYDVEYVQKQGLNGSVYALLALDAHSVPEGEQTAADDAGKHFVKTLLDAQEADGGWTIDTWTGVEDGSDADMTAMVLQALAPYVQSDEAVKAAADKALTFLSENQNDKGQFHSYGYDDCESSAQVLMALCALQIDPTADERFIKNGSTAYDSLMAFYDETANGFSHLMNGESNYLSTYQAFAAAAAYYRYMNQQTAYFDMKDVSLTAVPQTTPDISSETESSDESRPVSSGQEISQVPVQPSESVKTGDQGVLPLLVVLMVGAAAVSALSRRKHS